MKELSIEEKAKRYDEAIERAESIYNETAIPSATTKGICTYIFPELKESEDDRMIQYFKDLAPFDKADELYEKYGFSHKDAIAWLEKQCEQKIKTPEESLGIDSDTYNKIVDECIYGEQKPIDKVEPNFKVGDWVIWDNKIPCHVDNIYQGKNSLMYTITDTNNMTRSYSVKGFDNNAHLWTIQDARNGDILCSNQIIVLFKQWEDNTGYTFVIAHAGIDISGKLQITNGHWLINNKSKPATKEQRDLLFQKMHEAGYEWDADKKELRMIEQKPAWSEEDERNLQGIIDEIEANKNHAPDYDVATYNRFLSWLKSLKERYTWKPSEEQMRTLEHYIHTLVCTKYKEILFGLYSDLKELRGE